MRATKTTSGATAVQAIRYVHRRVVVVKHFGSAHTAKERQVLLRDAEVWLAKQRGQPQLNIAWDPSLSASVVDLDRLALGEARNLFAHKALLHVLTVLGFTPLLDRVITNLVIMRILEPSSKLRGIELLRRYFGIVHGRRTVYEALGGLASCKDAVECQLVAQATDGGALSLSLVLYDVTTLYFETFREDEPDDDQKGLRKTGFSKDNKPQQPQIVIGLLVTAQGFPLGYEVFRGNTFEGHTMLPVLTAFRERHKVQTCTVVADAAMLSLENIAELEASGLSYIVGARVANLSPAIFGQVTVALKRRDGATVRLPTKHGDLICSFSKERFHKDNHEMEKQIARAKRLIASGEPGRRAKFVLKQGGRYAFNEKLVEKAEKLLGIKGYVTNIPRQHMSDGEIIGHYRNLWRVEQDFRMSKSDLEIRPVFHRKEDAIRAHVLLCIIALAAQKHLEWKTGLSLRRIRDALLRVVDVTLTDPVTGKVFTKRSVLSEETRHVVEKMGMSY